MKIIIFLLLSPIFLPKLNYAQLIGDKQDTFINIQMEITAFESSIASEKKQNTFNSTGTGWPVCFWYLVKSDLSSVRVYSAPNWTGNFFKFTRKLWLCLSGKVVSCLFIIPDLIWNPLKYFYWLTLLKLTLLIKTRSQELTTKVSRIKTNCSLTIIVRQSACSLCVSCHAYWTIVSINFVSRLFIKLLPI